MLPSKRNLFKGAIVGVTALLFSVNTANAEKTESVEIANRHVHPMFPSLMGGIVEYFPLRSLAELEGTRTDRVAVNVEDATHNGYQAIQVDLQPTHTNIATPFGDNEQRAREEAAGACDACTFFNIGIKPFHNGIIEIDVADNITAAQLPGFIGIFFRVDLDEDNPKKSKYEGFYLRPRNSLAEERKNFTVQYVSNPVYPWYRLREENPGEYESYADIQPGAWTKIRIAVFGDHAAFYINNNPKPVLEVDDLKLGSDAMGTIGLYTDFGTTAYFKNLKITHAPYTGSM